ncbi:phosphonate ABC transporter ATP-binding protein [Hydrogenophaga intermedia]|jgi:phosphonate transport system ATP-binding protein|uniref:phosphonate ABC transporter ATP-binding protein n=1 Tax=Hydrogenophaga intermedia TaxID=65786 RepID=UPI002043A507|nr:phosphonate ABC transporter ATP-binding protein [Hydrogenophaga intermedia]MCM3563418.1 phosphonate ABC transporter ATP-binding protein [Hydrogenophaga intermedia]
MSALQRESLLKLQGVSVTYADGHRALQPTDLAVARGEFLVLLGASGAGKSTLLRSINGLVRPDGGRIEVDGLPGGAVSARNLREHRRRCAMVFQQHHLIGRQTVLANVLMGKLASRGSLTSLWPWSRADKLQALAVIDRVGLLDKALARADTLSGGQQQRVGIARALVQGPSLLLADEPVASLDPATAQGVLTLLHDICKKDHLTAVVSLHQVNLARLFADRIVGMRQGQLVFEGLPAQLTKDVESALYARAGTTSANHPPEAVAPTLAHA